MKNNSIISQLISILRFPLMAGVVVIHGGVVGSFIKTGAMKGDDMSFPITQYVENLVSHSMLGVCVPLFYFFSGYLFYKGDWGWKAYIGKIRRRSYSLFVPYILYTYFAILIFGVLQVLMPQLQSGAHIPIKDWCLWDFIYNGLWRYGDESIPFVGPFWFLRNLMIIVLISPCLYWYVISLRQYGVVLLGLLYCIDIWFPLCRIGSLDFFFFTWGGYFSIRQKDFTIDFKPYQYICWLSLPLFFFDAATKDTGWNVYVHRTAVLLGVMLIINIVAMLLNKREVKPNNMLVSSTFFIFAIHEPYLDQITKVMTMIVPLPKVQYLADCMALLIYLVYDVLIIVLLVLLYWCIHRISPRLALVLSGGRNS